MPDDQHVIKPSFRKDFLWYFFGSVLPLFIGFVRTPIFTRHFDREAFGQLGLVTITFSFLGMLLFSWISSCLWRYYSSYKHAGRLTILYSNLGLLFLLSFLFLGAMTFMFLWGSTDSTSRNIIMYAACQLIFNQLFLGYMVVIRLMGKSGYYNVFQGIRTLLGLFVALGLVFVWNADISALVSSLALVDMLSVAFLMVLNPAAIRLRFQDLDKSVLVDLLKYGSIGLILNLSLLSIAYSDRYIIALFYHLEEVGMYDQISKIAQLSVVALTSIYFNTINPVLLKKLDIDYKGALSFVQAYAFGFLFYGIPVVFYLSLFSKEIAHILLGEAFREGYVLMPFIFWAAFIQGLASFFELRLKFSDRMRKLGLIGLLTAVLNITLTYTFVGIYGYEWAAYTTLMTYAVMIGIFIQGDKEVLRHIWQKKTLMIQTVVLLTIQYLIYSLIVDKLEVNIYGRLTAGFIFALMYLLYFRKSIARVKLPMY